MRGDSVFGPVDPSEEEGFAARQGREPSPDVEQRLRLIRAIWKDAQDGEIG